MTSDNLGVQLVSKAKVVRTSDASGARKLAIVMPAFNEADSIESFLKEIIDYNQGLEIRVVVVNDASNDATGEVLSALENVLPELEVAGNSENIGHGPSTIRAMKIGLDTGAEFIVCTDGDGQVSAADLYRIAELAMRLNQVVEGVRRYRKDPWFRKLISTTTRILVFLRSGKLPRDANTPFRGYPRAKLMRLLGAIDEKSMTPNLLISALSRHWGWDLGEVVVNPVIRKGSNPLGSTWKQRFSFLPSSRLMRFVLMASKQWFAVDIGEPGTSSKGQRFARGLSGRGSIGRYSVIGLSGILVDLLLFVFLVALGVSPTLANLPSTFAGILNNYIWNSLINFKSPLRSTTGLRFVAVGTSGMALSTGLLSLLLDLGWAPEVAKATSIPLVVTFQFLANRFWTFKETRLK